MVSFLSTSLGFNLYLVFLIDCNGSLKSARFFQIRRRTNSFHFWKKRDVDTLNTARKSEGVKIRSLRVLAPRRLTHRAVMAAHHLPDDDIDEF